MPDQHIHINTKRLRRYIYEIERAMEKEDHILVRYYTPRLLEYISRAEKSGCSRCQDRAKRFADRFYSNVLKRNGGKKRG